MRAYADKNDFVSSTAPLSSHLVLGLDLDPASTDDLRHLVAQTLSPVGFVVAGIQMTESKEIAETRHADGSPADAADDDADAAPPPPPSPLSHGHAHTHAHAHPHVRGNAYNFASTPQHASAFELVGNQIPAVPCFRLSANHSLGCVEAAHNWFASLCVNGDHLGEHPSLSDMLHESTAGWPTGTRLVERCFAQRHFLGYQHADEGGSDNVRNTYFLRQLMGFCMFHGCKEEATLADADLAGKGLRASHLPEGAVLFG